MPKAQTTIRRCQVAALCAVVFGLVGCAIASQLTTIKFWHAYHVSFMYWWQITMGFLALGLLRCIVRSNWGNATWPYLKAALLTLLPVAMLFIPIMLNLSSIFPWAAASHHDGSHLNPFQADYYQTWFFGARSLVYFVIWFSGALIVVRTGTAAGEARLPRRLASFALIGLVLTTTFAAFDWGMSLEPEWYSTIYGAMVLMSGAVGSLAILVLSVAMLLRLVRLPRVRTRQILNDLGNLLLAVLMVWSYFAFSQYLIIWAGNLPAEVTWYVRRSAGTWQAVLLLVVAFHFAVPFFLLLSRERIQNPRAVGWIAVILIAANVVQTVWTYAPSFASNVTELSWALMASLLGMGGCWVLVFMFALQRTLSDDKLARRNSHD